MNQSHIGVKIINLVPGLASMSALYRLGFLVREAGVALDKLGCMLQGNFAFREQCKRSLNNVMYNSMFRRYDHLKYCIYIAFLQ